MSEHTKCVNLNGMLSAHKLMMVQQEAITVAILPPPPPLMPPLYTTSLQKQIIYCWSNRTPHTHTHRKHTRFSISAHLLSSSNAKQTDGNILHTHLKIKALVRDCAGRIKATMARTRRNGEHFLMI